MRDIKFRAWDKEEKKFIFSDDKYTNGYNLANFFTLVEDNPNYYIIEQYTGIKDKNGKDVYECDILKFYYKNSGKWFGIGRCFYDVEETAYRHTYQEVFDDKIEYDDFRPCKRFWCNETILCEIIGNIHENTELLEKM